MNGPSITCSLLMHSRVQHLKVRDAIQMHQLVQNFWNLTLLTFWDDICLFGEESSRLDAINSTSDVFFCNHCFKCLWYKTYLTTS